jgi:uncharacterized membrane protein YphA (DoxX/SURF4 family)
MKLWNRLLRTDRDKATILIRGIVGYVFVTEGIQKFVYSESLGVGRFLKIGIPNAEVMAPFVGNCEILFGFFIIIGFVMRLATIPQIIIMLTALATTKLPMLSEKGLLTFSHEARTDLLMLFGLVFLLVKGSGAFSVDSRIMERA